MSFSLSLEFLFFFLSSGGLLITINLIKCHTDLDSEPDPGPGPDSELDSEPDSISPSVFSWCSRKWGTYTKNESYSTHLHTGLTFHAKTFSEIFHSFL